MAAVGKHPVLVGLLSGLAAALLLWLAGFAACLAFMGISGVGPGGGGWPPSTGELTIGIVALLIGIGALTGAVFCARLIFKAWRRLRQDSRWEWLKPRG